MKFLDSLASALSTAIGWIGGAVMLLMMLQVTCDVLLKHFLNHPIPNTLELVASYYMVALVFLPLGMVTRDQDHLEVELFTQKLRPRPLACVQAFGCVVGAVYVVLVLDRTIEEALYMTRIGEVWETATWNMPVWPSRWFAPIGLALTLIWLILHGINFTVFAITGRHVLARAAHHDLGREAAS